MPRLLSSFIGFLVALLILEIGAQLLPEKKEPSLFLEDSLTGVRYLENLNTTVPSESGKGRIPFITNGYGFVGNDWKEKHENKRVANFGDSFTVGAAVPYEKNYVSKVGLILSQKLGKKVESINFGVSNQGTKEALLTYRNYGRKANADVVILWMYLGNDFSDNLRNVDSSASSETRIESKEKQTIETKKSILVRLLKKSAFFRLAKNILLQSPFKHRIVSALSLMPGIEKFLYQVTLDIPNDLLLLYTDKYEMNDLAISSTKEFLTEFKKDVQKDGKGFFVVIIPPHFTVDGDAKAHLLKQYPELKEKNFDPQKPREYARAMLSELSIPFFDLSDEFTRKCQNACNLYVCRFCHLSQGGHDLAGTLVAEELYLRYFNNQTNK